MQLFRPIFWLILAAFISFIFSIPVMATTTISNGFITANTIWGPGATGPNSIDDTLFIIADDIEVRNGATLTILPGTTLKFQAGLRMTVGPQSNQPGKLVAEGNAAQSIIFTSYTADRWRGINLAQYANLASSIKYCIIENTGSGHALEIRAESMTDRQPEISHNTFQNNSLYAIYAIGAPGVVVRPLISENIFNNNGIDNGIAIYCWNAEPVIEYNDLSTNTDYTIQNASVNTYCVLAENNWWGYDTGPYDGSGPNQECGNITNPGGQGGPVSDGVNYEPWLSQSITALRPPTPLTPEDGDCVYNSGLLPVLTVTNSPNSTPGSTVYEFQVSTANDDWTSPVAQADDVAEDWEAGTTSWQVDTALQELVPHFWRVRAIDGSETSFWSEELPPFTVPSFTIDIDDPPLAFDLLRPYNQETATAGNDGINPTQQPTLTWEDAENGDLCDQVRYTVYWDNEPGLPTPDSVTDISALSYTFSFDLTDNTIYYWQVEAYDSRGSRGQSQWSSIREFAVNLENDPPTIPTFNSPIPGYPYDGCIATLVANNSTDPDPYSPDLIYHFQVSEFNYFNPIQEQNSAVPEGSGGTTSWTTPPLPEDTWFWRVRAGDGTDWSDWPSNPSSRSFTTHDCSILPPTIVSPEDGSTIYDDQTPLLIINEVSAPDYEPLVYDFDLATSDNFAVDTIESATGLTGAGNLVQWQVTNTLNWDQQYYWRARARTLARLAGEYVVASFTMNGPPNPPTINSPLDGAIVPRTPVSTLVVNNATDDEGDTGLTYDFYFADNPGFNPLLDSELAMTEAPAGTTSWTPIVDLPLDPQATYYWQCRASDNYLSGDYVTASFTTDANEQPGTPTINSPQDGAVEIPLSPTLIVNNTTDPEGDELDYEFDLATDDTFQIGSIMDSGTIPEGAGTTTGWTPTTRALNVSTTYWWRCRANDNYDPGAYVIGSFTTIDQFCPQPPTVFSPLDEADEVSLSPTLIVTNAYDEEGDDLTYDFDLATSTDFENDTFISATALLEGSETTSWAPAVTLGLDTEYYWRCRAVDPYCPGEYIQASFRTIDNDPPGPPGPVILPPDGATAYDSSPLLRINEADDPEGDPLEYDFDFATSPDFDNDTIESISGLTGNGTYVEWQVSGPLDCDRSTYYWRSRAVDPYQPGAYTEASFTMNGPPDQPTNPDPFDGETDVSLFPQLCVDNAIDLESDDLTYDFDLATSLDFDNDTFAWETAVSEGSGQTCWTPDEPDIPLNPTTTYYWRFRASDDFCPGEYGTASFTTTDNTPPTTPVINSPPDGSTVYDQTPLIVVDKSSDNEGDDLTYYFELWTDNFTTFIESSTALTESGDIVQWQVTTVLAYDRTTYQWQARAKDASLYSEWVQSSFTMNGPPYAPNISDPQNGEDGVSVSPQLCVHNVFDPEDDDLTYDFDLSTSTDFENDTFASVDGISEGIGTTCWTPAVTLEHLTEYFWRCRVFDGFAPGGYTIASFTTGDIPSFHLIAPEDEEIVYTDRPLLEWEEVIDLREGRVIDYYEVYYSLDLSFDQVINGIESSFYQFEFDLLENETYYWKVFAFDSYGYSKESIETWSFSIDASNVPPSDFDLIWPPYGEIVEIQFPVLEWEQAMDEDPADAVFYQIYVETTSNFVNPLATGLTSTTYSPSGLVDNTGYFWRVEAYDLAENTTIGNPIFSYFHLNYANDCPYPPAGGFSPGNGSTTGDPTPIISWDPAEDPDIDDPPETLWYVLELAANSNFTAATSHTAFEGTTQVEITPALSDGIWYYRVKTYDDQGCGSDWSVTISFEIVSCGMPTQPVAQSPIGNSIVTDTTPDLTVVNATDPQELDLTYTFQVATSSTFSSQYIVASESGVTEGNNTTTWIANPGLADNTIHFWRTFAENADCSGNWSDYAEFCVNLSNDAPTAPELMSPLEGAEAFPDTELEWASSTDDDCYENLIYEVQISDDDDFSPVMASGTVSNTSVVLQDLTGYDQLSDDEWYYWRVRADDQHQVQSRDISDFSQTRSFCLNKENDPPDDVTSGFNPADDECVFDNTPNISWDAADDADCGHDPQDLHYVVQLNISSSFGNPARTITTEDGISMATITPLLADNQWFYRIRAVDPLNEPSGWSETQSFVVDAMNNGPPSQPALELPPDGAEMFGNDYFEWTISNDPDPCDQVSYTLQILDSVTRDVICEGSDLTETSIQIGGLDCGYIFEDGQTYWWQVQARDQRQGQSGFSDSRSFVYIGCQPSTVPEPYFPADGVEVNTPNPTLCVHNSTDPNDPPSTPLTYDFEVALDPNFATIVFNADDVGQAATNTCTLVSTDLEEDETYYWHARSKNTCQVASAWSDPFEFCLNEVNSPPSAPTGLNPDNCQEAWPQDDLCWYPATDPDCGSTTISYQLRIAEDPDFNSIVVSWPNIVGTCLDLATFQSQLDDDNNYYWQVIASESGGGQSISQTACFCYNDGNSNPYPPTDGFWPANNVEIDTQTPTIQWNTGIDPDCSDYPENLIYLIDWWDYDGGGSGSDQTEYGQTSFTIPPNSPLSENGHWFYQVRTQDHEGAPSDPSDIQSFWVNVLNEPPSAPTNLQPDNEAEVRVQDYFTWDASTDPDPPTSGRDIITYTLELALDAGFNDIQSTNPGISPNSFLAGNLENLADLEDGMLYYWRVTAVDDDGLSTTSAYATTILQKCTPPEMPTIIAPPNGTEIMPEDQLCWTEPYDPDPGDVLHYNLQISLSQSFSSLFWDEPEDTCYVLSSAMSYLEDDLTYYWRVWAIDNCPFSSDTTDGSNWFRYNEENDPPNQVSGLSPAEGQEITTLLPFINWQPTADPDWSDSTFIYTLTLATNSDFSDIVDSLSTSGTQVQVGPLTENQHYFYRVIALDDQDASSIPAVQDFWINTEHEPPAPPGDLDPGDCALELDANGQLCWTPAIDPDPLPYGGLIDYYRVQFAEDEDFADPADSMNVTAACLSNLDQLAGLSEDTQYYWRVLAVDIDGLVSNYSETGCFTLNFANNPPHP
ncbi:MAG: right-handed parallel beta-helix repeat-containing protein, partial [Planctomycetes bacterium]|nr:right-handed parallel beta-helix repeat-containing protein [Planctomycetota bacterium]